MKTILATLLLISQAAVAAESHEVINTTAAVYAQDLKCVLNLGLSNLSIEERMYTAIGVDDGGYMINLAGGAELELPQPLLTANGCDVAALDALVNKSNHFFGFIHGTPVKLTKHLSPSVKTANGCEATYSEKVEIDIDGLKLSGDTYVSREMTDCK